MSTYSKILILSGIIPLLFSFHPRIRFYLKWKYFFISNFLISVPFLIWDSIFTKNKVWDFSNDHISGIKINNLPLEEILFFIVIPYCFIFTYHVLKDITSNIQVNRHLIKTATLLSGITMTIIGAYNANYMYTSTTLIALGLILILMGSGKGDYALVGGGVFASSILLIDSMLCKRYLFQESKQGLWDIIFNAYLVKHVPSGEETGWLAKLEGLGDFAEQKFKMNKEE